MAVLYIKEYESLGTPGEGGNAQIAKEPPVAEQTVAIGGASVQSAAFNARTRFIRLECDVICAVAIGPNPIATTQTTTNTNAAGGGGRMAANDKEYLGVSPGHKAAVISTT